MDGTGGRTLNLLDRFFKIFFSDFLQKLWINIFYFLFSVHFLSSLRLIIMQNTWIIVKKIIFIQFFPFMKNCMMNNCELSKILIYYSVGNVYNFIYRIFLLKP